MLVAQTTGLIASALLLIILSELDARQIGSRFWVLSAVESVAASIGVAVFASVFFASDPCNQPATAPIATLVVQLVVLGAFLTITFLFPRRPATMENPLMPKKTSPIAMPLEDVRSLPIAVNPIGRQLQEIAVLTRVAADHLGTTLGINRTDLAAMEQLMTDGPLPPTELAARLNVTTAGITQVIDRLERAGHVVRERQLDDKRRVLVKPVQASVAQTYRHIAPMLMSLNTVLDALEPAERALIEQFLSRVINAYRTTLPGANINSAPPTLESKS